MATHPAPGAWPLACQGPGSPGGCRIAGYAAGTAPTLTPGYAAWLGRTAYRPGGGWDSGSMRVRG
ncbi:hypothetical protein ACWEOW_09280 [Monashia sp. NPDC004114]